jgi:predicted nucleotidyltransferase
MPTTWSVRDGLAHWNGRPLGAWVDDLVAEIASELDPLAIWLLGSVARGDDDADSDIDLLVVLRSYSSTDAVALKRRVHAATKVPVPFDVAFTDPARFTRRSKIAGTLERAASREGRRVYERG